VRWSDWKIEGFKNFQSFSESQGEVSGFGAVGEKRTRRKGRGLRVEKEKGRFYRVKEKFEGLKIQIDQQKLHKEIRTIKLKKQDKRFLSTLVR